MQNDLVDGGAFDFDFDCIGKIKMQGSIEDENNKKKK